VDAELLRGPRLDRPGPVDRNDGLLVGKVLVELLDDVGGCPAVRALDQD
jgi:hypothetical protein